MAGIRHYISRSAEETVALGYEFGLNLPANSIVCFFGDLAAGKTTFIRGLTAGVLKKDHVQISSPTFVYLNIYGDLNSRKIYHFDLYRLRDADEFLSMGFDEMLFAGEICCVEWPERITSLLPSHCIHVTLSHEAENVRRITIAP